MQRKKLPVGIEDFEKLRKEGFYYIDKTGLIEELLSENPSKVSLFTRPRRFGKTLMMTMLRDFFDIRQDSKAIFEGRENVAEDIANRYGFKKAKASEIAWDYKGNRIGFMNNPDALWRNNYVVDFTDKDLGLDEAFLRNYTNTGTGEIVIPGRTPRFTADDVKDKPFGDIELKEYQSKAQNIFRKRE